MGVEQASLDNEIRGSKFSMPKVLTASMAILALFQSEGKAQNLYYQQAKVVSDRMETQEDVAEEDVEIPQELIIENAKAGITWYESIRPQVMRYDKNNEMKQEIVSFMAQEIGHDMLPASQRFYKAYPNLQKEELEHLLVAGGIENIQYFLLTRQQSGRGYTKDFQEILQRHLVEKSTEREYVAWINEYLADMIISYILLPRKYLKVKFLGEKHMFTLLEQIPPLTRTYLIELISNIKEEGHIRTATHSSRLYLVLQQLNSADFTFESTEIEYTLDLLEEIGKSSPFVFRKFEMVYSRFLEDYHERKAELPSPSHIDRLVEICRTVENKVAREKLIALLKEFLGDRIKNALFNKDTHTAAYE